MYLPLLYFDHFPPVDWRIHPRSICHSCMRKLVGYTSLGFCIYQLCCCCWCIHLLYLEGVKFVWSFDVCYFGEFIDFSIIGSSINSQIILDSLILFPTPEYVSFGCLWSCCGEIPDAVFTLWVILERVFAKVWPIDIGSTSLVKVICIRLCEMIS